MGLTHYKSRRSMLTKKVSEDERHSLDRHFKASRLATSTAEDLKANKAEWVLSNRSQSNKTVSAQQVPKPTKVRGLA